MSEWSKLGPNFLSEGQWSIGQGPDSADRLFLRRLIRVMGKNNPVDLLDIGFGPAIDAAAVEDDGLLDRVNYRGIDATPELVARARELYPWGEWHEADVHDFCARRGNNPSPFAKSAELTWMRHVLEHVDDGKKALGQAWRSTRGVLIVSWFIRPTWVESQVGNKVADGFNHHTYSARSMVAHCNRMNALSYRFDFQSHLSDCSLWILCRPGYEGVGGWAAKAVQEPWFLRALLPAVDRENERAVAALSALAELRAAGAGLAGMPERIRDLEFVAGVAEAALGSAEGVLFPSQDEPGVRDVIRSVRDAKARCVASREGVRPVGDDGRDQVWRDAVRKAEDLLHHEGFGTSEEERFTDTTTYGIEGD